ncbi:MAG: ribonuclease III [Nitrospirae bacterium]|nr:ribonuclease III [Nitrospirota bacterium]
MLEDKLANFQKILGCTFHNTNLLIESVTHKSYINEKKNKNRKDNEILEFLGDAVLNLIISEYLIKTYPHLAEGDLSKIRSMVVNESTLSDIARKIDLGNYLFLGSGEEQSGGRNKNSILANALEAIIAAIYSDSNLNGVAAFVIRNFEDIIRISAEKKVSFDFKTELQEFCQRCKLPLPVYKVSGERGPEHEKVFEIELLIDNKVFGRGSGRSKKEAEQIAAEEAIKKLKMQNAK